MALALGTSLLFVGCKKTVEGENQAWQRNLQRINELAALYPSFANALHEQQKKADEAMSAARSVGDKEQAAKAMADANSMIDSGFVYALSQMDSRMRSVRDKIVSAGTGATDPADQVAARAVTDDAQRILKGVDDALKAGAADANSATVVVRKLEGDLSSAGSNLDKVIDAARQRKAAAAAAAKPAAGTTAPAAPVAKVQWKCSYCNHMNDDARSKCENCGAPRQAPKTPTPAKKK
jgi:hypothetical protein